MGSTSGWLLAGTTIFAGAFLLFEVEPLIAKAILPWFGGSAQVWTTCLLFFQAALLAGYLYAHVLSRLVAAEWQAPTHAALLILSLTFLPIFPAEIWKPSGMEEPLFSIVGVLASTIGLPFVLLSATNPLMQSWLARAYGKPPYRLFALSNFGSMMGLIAYPLVVEPSLSLRTQIVGWSSGYVLFSILCGATALAFRSRSARPLETAAQPGQRPSRTDRVLWIGLSAAPAGVLLALTNYMLQNIAAIPLFWIIPLALYLLSFIVAFGGLHWYSRPLWLILFSSAIAILIATLSGYYVPNDVIILPLFCLLLFVCCFVCHAELAAIRPAADHLTTYYLLIAAGGVVGALFVAAVAPVIFNAALELPILVPLMAMLILVAVWRPHRRADRPVPRATFLLAVFLLTSATLVMADAIARDLSLNMVVARNFYGTLRVMHFRNGGPESLRRAMLYSMIDHGQEYVMAEKRREPLTYFTHASGVGKLFEALKDAPPLRVGVTGLGIGTLAAYCRPGDHFRFYELNPLAIEIAERDFWYLSSCYSKVEIVPGDARLSLEREQSQDYDVMILDAFLGDAVPMHLLTREAMALYRRHLKPGGILAVNITNRYVDFSPVVASAAAELNAVAYRIVNGRDDAKVMRPAEWMIVAQKDFFSQPPFEHAEKIVPPDGFRPWTDDYSNLWMVFRPRR